MHRAIPVSNKLLSKKWDDRNQAVHEEKLRSMRPTVDSATPVTFPYAVSKAKKEQLMEDRYTEIERENRLLLEKMSTIMQTHHQSRERTTRKRSLNQEFRRREMTKITMENQALLRRLQERQPSYSIHKWETDRKRTERLLHNICEFPYQLGVTAYIAGVEESRKRYGSVEARMATRSEIGSAPLVRTLMSSRKPGSTNTAGDRPRKLAPIPKDDSKEVLFKRGMNINEKYFLVEVSQIPGLITITAFDIESPDSYNLELGLREAMELMGGERNYEKLVTMLAFERGELMLVDRRREESPRQHAQTTHRKQKNTKRGSPQTHAKNREEAKDRVNSSSPKQKTPSVGVNTPDKGKPGVLTPVPAAERQTDEEHKLTDTERDQPKNLDKKPPEEAIQLKSPFTSSTPPMATGVETEKKEPGRDPIAMENGAFDLSQSADFGPKPAEKKSEDEASAPVVPESAEARVAAHQESKEKLPPPAISEPLNEVYEDDSQAVDEAVEPPAEQQASPAAEIPPTADPIEANSEKAVVEVVQESMLKQNEDAPQRVEEAGVEQREEMTAAVPVEEKDEAVPEAVSEVVPEAVSEAVPEAVSEVVPEAVSEAVPEAVPEVVPEAVSEAVPEAVSEAVPEAVSEAVPEAVSEAVPEAVSEAVPEAVSEAVPEAVPEAATKLPQNPDSEQPSDQVPSSHD